MGWIVLLPGLVLLRIASKRMNGLRGNGATVGSLITLAFAVIAGLGFAYTFLARWTANGINWGASIATNVTGDDLTTAVPLAVTVAALGVLVVDVAVDRQADRGALIAGFFLPMLLLLVAGGALGDTGGDAVRSGYTQVASFMNQFGG